MKIPKLKTKEDEKRYEECWKRDHVLVRGKFSNLESKGAPLTFPYQKYHDDEFKTYIFEDGKNYEIPFMVAKWIATDVGYIVHENKKDENGKRAKDIGKKVNRFNFQKLDFADDNVVIEKSCTTDTKVHPVIPF